MKAVIQRVKEAKVIVDEKVSGEIGQGFLVYICFESGDKIESIDQIIHKIINLRIFNDQEQKMNLNIKQIAGSILSVSQFTLSWDGKKGHRPSFDKSMKPMDAKIFYRTFNDKLQEQGIKVAKGIFGAEMLVESINDGPVTFFLEY